MTFIADMPQKSEMLGKPNLPFPLTLPRKHGELVSVTSHRGELYIAQKYMLWHYDVDSGTLTAIMRL